MSEQLDTLLEPVRRDLALVMAAIAEQKENGKAVATMDPALMEKAVLEIMAKQQQANMIAGRADEGVQKGTLIGPEGFQVPFQGVCEEPGRFYGQKVSDLIFVKQLMDGFQKQRGSRVKPASKELITIVEKALTATGSGSGDEYVNTGMASELWQDAFLASKVVSNLLKVPMPTDPFDLPVGWGDITWRKGTQNTAVTANTPATAKSTLTATEIVAEVDFSYDLDEDAVIAILPSLKTELARSAGEAMDAFALNADATNAGTGNINLDDADPADDSYYLTLGQDGIRHLYIVDNTAMSADINTTLTDALFLAGLAKLSKYGVDPNQVALFCPVKVYLASLLGLANARTWDKYGPSATILTGELAKVSGIPVVPSSQMLLAEDDGKQSTTGSNNDEGQIALVHRPSWRVGFRRQIMIELDRNIQNRSFIMVVSFRMAVAARGTRSTATHTAGIHGITF
jgi:HK97 family phage major capsid protein